MQRFAVIFSLILLTSIKVYSQNEVQIIQNGKIVKSFSSKDSTETIEKLYVYLEKNRQKGFIAASFDSLIYDSTIIKAFFVQNNKFIWNDLTFENFQKEDYKVLNPKDYINKPVNFKLLEKQTHNIVFNYTCKGYPFAQISYDSLIFTDSTISTTITLDTNNYIIFDSIYFADEINIRESFLQNYLQFKKGNEYNELIVEKIPDKLANLPFLNVQFPSEVEFHTNSADLYLYLKNKKASEFSGILGFTNANEKFTLVGEADLKIVNMFKNADRININWQKTKDFSQNINVDFSFPYLLNTNIGIDNSLKIEKYDTTYINVFNKSLLSYYFSGFSSTSLFVDFQTSIVFDTLSDYEYFRSKLFGISLNFNQTNDYFLPTKGFIYKSSAGAGNKTSSDTIAQQLSFEQNISFYQPLFNDFVVVLKNNTKLIKSIFLFENELIKFGGTNLMRGFDEQSLSASFLNISTIELKYLLQKRTNVFVFTDYAIMQHKSTIKNYWLHPLGLGAGFTLSTKNGILSITYAIGKTESQNFILKNSKIHFGFSTYF